MFGAGGSGRDRQGFECAERGVDRGEVRLDDRAAPPPVRPFDVLLHGRHGIVEWQQVREREEADLHDRVDLAGEACVSGDAVGVDDVHVEPALDDLLLHLPRELCPRVGRRIRAVEQERGAGGGMTEHVDPIEEPELVAGDEVASPFPMRYVESIGASETRRCEIVIDPAFFES